MKVTLSRPVAESRVPPILDWYVLNASASPDTQDVSVRCQSFSLNMSLTSGGEDEGGAGVDDTSGRRQDDIATITNRLVDTTEG